MLNGNNERQHGTGGKHRYSGDRRPRNAIAKTTRQDTEDERLLQASYLSLSKFMAWVSIVDLDHGPGQ